ncbi:ABC transporter ATP-binding protein [Conexibacter sp. JD483]|uniref:ABC transporter ATP-binding protein n=1 Tax=unclassified Conexibacter TaxID=2627773 RepID=UPI00271A724F|nr:MULTISPECIES: ABC transporter ATP-binding protein [unclassified Conexibacter]MDO8185588.1 ABC transporter ATP-binding protein [Conexibacter sp. CPCC 205706]MDO8198761.1 ABC transporter ATP-binding protein [Conexibacter sp. CPCC 205762]MDR9367889.1 ABC transporter ATP-binding protein [Conexibacter sp. JD483]
MSALLELQGLSIRLPTPAGSRAVVHEVDLAVEAGQIYGIAGESGSGKTMTMLSLLGLLPRGGTVHGRASFAGRDILSADKKARQALRGRDLSMVFQDPMTSLHPMLTVGKQLTEHARKHLGLSKGEAAARAAQMLEDVRIPDGEAALRAYPHEFSGGMRQRIAIAIALMCEPQILIADEPTTALDVTVQAGILALLDRLRREKGMAVVLITHDLGVMSSIAERISVMYAGRVIESGDARDVLKQPSHPYTRGLLGSLPQPGLGAGTELRSIPGVPASPLDPPRGCAFHPRCALAVDACKEGVPPLLRRGDHAAACIVTMRDVASEEVVA